MKIADFGLSALVRIDEGGYDPEESGKRKNYRALKDVGCLASTPLSCLPPTIHHPNSTSLQLQPP
ncbi:hypothetical protein EON63_12265 [archaeon]|nr:MAG: hypothetical protein EON63_12265 [archaeon]